MKPAAFLLAAGRGRRAGGPKAWMLHEGRPLLERQLEFLGGFFGAENVFVSIQEEWLGRCRGLDSRARWLAVDPDAPPLQSLQALLLSSPLSSWGFVHHVDMPVWEEDLFESLLAAAHPGPDAVVPTHNGRRGHPVLLSPESQKKLVSLDPAQYRLDFWLREASTCAVELPFACILENWNAPVHA